MKDRGTAEDAAEAKPVSGAEPTLAAGPEHARVSATSARDDGREPPVKDWTGRDVAARYRILERIGEGGMGVVYVAEHLTLRKKLAFKVIHPELAAHAELMARFKREALATGQLDHPHITAAIDFDTLPDGGAFLVMPWVRGHSLQAEIDKTGKFDLRRAAEICAQIADALSAAHAVGIVHRDLKPDNVMLEQRTDGTESAKVLDFGVASLAGRAEGISVDARPLTQAGTVLGTPGYMSPEQASAGEVDYRSDLYALGVILWELCRGERLFSGSDITQIFAKQFREAPPSLELGHSPAARELSALVTRLLSWDRAARPASASEVRDTLRRIATLNQQTLLPDKARALFMEHKRAAPFAAGALVVLLAFLWLALRDTSEATIVVNPDLQDAVVIEPPASAVREAEKRVEAPKVAPTPKVTPTPAPAPTPKPAPVVVEQPPVSAPAGGSRDSETARRERELREARDTLIEGTRSSDARRNAAKQVLNTRGAPRYIELAAEFEMATRCKERKKVVAAIKTLGDPRLLPLLERLSVSSRNGCGFLRLSDCWACLRRDLDGAMDALGGSGK